MSAAINHGPFVGNVAMKLTLQVDFTHIPLTSGDLSLKEFALHYTPLTELMTLQAYDSMSVGFLHPAGASLLKPQLALTPQNSM